MALEVYDLILALIGVSILGVALLPRFISDKPITFPIFYLGFGFVIFALPLGLPAPDPLEFGSMTERLTEFGVIIALMVAGLKIDRRPYFSSWETAWRLLAVTMPVTIAAVAILGWWVVGFAIPTAALLGAVIAPTDPVLATEVQVEKPEESPEDEPEPGVEGYEDEVRFALTAEAGLNDGLAFPFTNLAIALAFLGTATGNWVGEWVLVDVLYRIAIAVVGGIGIGWVVASATFDTEPTSLTAKSMVGLEALAGTLLVYGITEFVGGYGFIAVFVAAVTMRNYEHGHERHDTLHDLVEKFEQLLMAVIMVAFGGAIVGGLFDPLTVELVAVAAGIVFLVRPAAAALGLLGYHRDWRERAVIAFFGVRGIGSFYYLAYGLNHAPFRQARTLWALVGCVVLISVIVHGVTATPAVERITGEAEPE